MRDADTPPENTTRLYVCNLPYNFMRDHVAQTFQEVRPTDIVIPTSSRPGQLNMGYAFVTVLNDFLDRALAYNGQPDPFFGRLLKVEVARPRAPRPAYP
jgi:hypothetical protein